MIKIDSVLVSDDLLQKHFLCDLAACKGACCVEGESGAPLEEEELEAIERNLPAIEAFMRPEGIEALREQGLAVVDVDGELVSPLVNGAECAFVHYDERGVAKCAMESAYRAGKSDFYKPISCHLYPIRISDIGEHLALNYHHWPICDPARTCGLKAELRVFRFLREALIRKFGEEFYQKLEAAAEYLEDKNREAAP